MEEEVLEKNREAVRNCLDRPEDRCTQECTELDGLQAPMSKLVGSLEKAGDAVAAVEQDRSARIESLWEPRVEDLVA
jgi:hypothetical protein